MKRLLILAITVSTFIISCNNTDKIPDVSGIKINLSTDRFERKLFDTTAPSLSRYLQELQISNPAVLSVYITQILGADPTWPADTTATYINDFIRTYRPVYNDIEKKIPDFSKYESQLTFSFQLIKHYFNTYKTPEKIITYIGPADGYKAILIDEGLLLGLQSYLGKDHNLYKTDMVSQFYPAYISQRFEPEYIPVDCIKTIINTDLYPEKENDKPMVSQMIERGKRLYLLSKFLPETDEYKLIGYTESQMKDCIKREAFIWDMFVKNDLLQSLDKNLMKNYIEDGPKTQSLGEGAPGNIGSFAGWQIVKKYMHKNPATTLQQLIKMDEETLFQDAKYKP